MTDAKGAPGAFPVSGRLDAQLKQFLASLRGKPKRK